MINRPYAALTLASVLSIAWIPASASAGTVCDKPAAQLVPADPALCLRRIGSDIQPGSRDVSTMALIDHARLHIAAGRFDAAREALDCAEPSVGGNGLLRYEWVRQRGILDYRQERIPAALTRFECAAALARERGDQVALARDLKNVGSALRRLGDLRGALASLEESLRLQRAAGDTSGMVLRNIADVYKALGEGADAMRYYADALSAFRAGKDLVEEGHTLETMSQLALDDGDNARADIWLNDALALYRRADHHAYQLRAHAGLIRVALQRGEIDDARHWAARASAIATARGMPLPAPLQLQIARVDRVSGRLREARQRLTDVIAQMSLSDVDLVPLYDELSAVLEAEGNQAGAIANLRKAREVEGRLLRGRYDEQLGWLRTRFESVERERKISQLEQESRQRRLELGLISSIAVAALALFAIIVLRWRQRIRASQRAREAMHLAELERFRREADMMTVDLNRLQALSDGRSDPACLLDGDGIIIAANAAAAALLSIDRDILAGHALTEALGMTDAAGALKHALEKMEDMAATALCVVDRNGVDLWLSLSASEHGDGWIDVTMRRAPEQSRDAGLLGGTDGADAADGAVAADVAGDQGGGVVATDDFRRDLVELMLASVEAWERVTSTNRIELAQKSRIWRVNIDDGRLRARVMERYLSMARIPSHPRWRDVVRTAYYVLGHCELEEDVRLSLKQRLDAVLALARRDALS